MRILIGAVVSALIAGYWWGSRRQSRQAFVLLVDVTFRSVHDRDAALELWKPVAVHCRDHEAGTLTYEAAISDSVPERIVFVERYATKNDYLHVHKSSRPFLAFRAKLAEFEPRISGHSYITTDIGFF